MPEVDRLIWSVMVAHLQARQRRSKKYECSALLVLLDDELVHSEEEAGGELLVLISDLHPSSTISGTENKSKIMGMKCNTNKIRIQKKSGRN